MRQLGLQLLFVFLGGGLGSVCRFLAGRAIATRWASVFPWGTFTVNIVGCFSIGLTFAIVEKHRLHDVWALFLATGFCGGFTTFSSFAYEKTVLLRNGDYLAFFLYAAASLAIGMLAALCGFVLLRDV